MYVIFNGKKDSDIGISTMSIPNTLVSGNKIYETKTLPGQEGDLNEFKGYSDTILPVEYNFYNLKGNLQKQWDIIKGHFNNITDNKLVFSNDLEHCYKVKRAEIFQSDRSKFIGRFKVNFICEPFCYLLDGQQGIKLDSSKKKILYNPCFAKAKPIFKVIGEGKLTIQINNKSSCSFNIGQKMIIDTQRKLCYRNKDDFINSAMNGKYKNLYLDIGENEIEIIGDKLSVELIPNWREN